MPTNVIGYPVIKKAPDLRPSKLDSLYSYLNSFGISTPISTQSFNGDEIKDLLPNLNPENWTQWDNYFKFMASQVGGDLLAGLENLQSNLKKFGIPKLPKVRLSNKNILTGWTQWDRSGAFVTKVSAPQAPFLIFDTETFVAGGNYPIMATACDFEYFYLWIAKEFLFDIPESEWNQFDLVPLPHTKVIVC